MNFRTSKKTNARMAALFALLLYGLPLASLVTAHTSGMVSMVLYGILAVAAVVSFVALTGLYRDILEPAAPPSVPRLPPATDAEVEE